MSQRIQIRIRNKIATCLTDIPVVCGNSDYVIDFDFDKEWDEHHLKTARFKTNGEFTDVVFEGKECPMPILSNTNIAWVGVFAGDLSTSTPAIVHCKYSILDGDDNPSSPIADGYVQIIQMMEAAEESASSAAESAKRAEEAIQHTAGKGYKNTDGEILGEIFNDYGNNQANGLYSHVENHNNSTILPSSHVEGSYNHLDKLYGYEVDITKSTSAAIETDKQTQDSKYEITIPLNSTSGLEVGMTCFVYQPDDTEIGGWARKARGYVSKVEASSITIITSSEITAAKLASSDKSDIFGKLIIAGGTVGDVELTNLGDFFTSHVEGQGNIATFNSHAEGMENKAIGLNSHVEGKGNVASGERSHAEGGGTRTRGFASHAEGVGGEFGVASGYASHVEGSSTIAAGDCSHAENNAARALGENSHAEGFDTLADGVNSHSEGERTSAEGRNSHAEGSKTTAQGLASHAEGNSSKALGAYAHTEGYYCTASGETGHAEGFQTEAGPYSHSEGRGTVASGYRSHAEGTGTKATAYATHAEGDATEASGLQSHAEGHKTIAGGYASHAEGHSSQATGAVSHAEGSATIASNNYAHAQGYMSIASGEASHAGGVGTQANGRGSYAGGLFNKPADDNGNPFLESVGNGTTINNRANARTLDYEGNAWFAGGVAATTYLKIGNTLITEDELKALKKLLSSIK